MKSVVLEKPGEFRVAEVAAPEQLGPEEALISPKRVGVCGTDLHAYEGKQPYFRYPRVLGHELGVEVIAVGAGVKHVKPGDRCAVEPYLYCGDCIACRRGRTNCCLNVKVLGVHIDGGMCERIKVPARNLHPSAKLSLEQLALVEPLGIGAHAVRRGAPEPGEATLVIGAGPIGLATATFVQESGARLIQLDVSEKRLEFCRRIVPKAQAVLAPEDPGPELQRLLGGDLPTLVFDCTGNPASMHRAFRLIAHGGRLVFVGLFPGDVTFSDPDFHMRETTLLASRNAAAEDFRRIIGLMEGGRIDVGPWISARVKPEGLGEMFPQWLHGDGEILKAMVEW